MIELLAAPIPQMLRKVALLLLCMLPLSVIAQGESWIRKGNAAYEDQNYPKAIEYYSWAVRKKAGAAAYEGLGNAYWASKDYPQAETYYRLAAQKTNSNPLNHFYLGRALLANQKIKAAEDAFKKYAKAAPNSPMTAFADINTFFPIFLGDSANFEITKLPINSSGSDFAPAWYKDGIAFSSSRRNAFRITSISTVDGAPLIDLWYAEQMLEGEWIKPQPIRSLNSELNEGPLSIDTNSGKLYFTRNQQGPKRKNNKTGRLNRLNIYEAEWVENAWTNIRDLPFNSDEIPLGHPSISTDGQQMYFSAEFPDAIGGADIYVATREGDTWSAPRNLGPTINSVGDELFPYIMADGSLVIASDGHLGLGGLDLFSVRPNGRGGWRSPVNLGYPLNTYADDFGYLAREGGKSGFFSSNRGDDVGNDNLYAFRMLRPVFDCNPQEENNYCFQFYDRGGEDIDTDSLPVLFEWNLGNGVRLLGDTVEYCFPGPGIYRVELNLIDTVTGFTFLNKGTYDMEINAIPQVLIEGPDTVAAGKEVTFYGKNSIVTDCSVEEYYWEFSDGRRATGESITHIFARPGRYQVRLGTAGDSLDGTRRCLSCVFREILVLPSPRIKAIQDSLDQQRTIARELQSSNQVYHDSIRQVEHILKTIKAMSDSSRQFREVSIPDDIKRQSPRQPGFSGIDIKGYYSRDPLGMPNTELPSEKAPATNTSPLQPGFNESILMDVEDKEAGTNYQIRIPAKIAPQGVTILLGTVRDSKGQPLEANVSLEDIGKGLRIVHSKSDKNGNYRLEIPNGSLYGYFIDLPEYYPVSQHVDLRKTYSKSGQAEILIQKDIQMLTVKEIFEKGISVRINNVFFDHDSWKLRPESHLELDRLARILIENPGLDVEILGHTDSDGSPIYNQNLSRQRANSILRYLILSGYSIDKISAHGYGEARPVAGNDTPEGKQLNRRVEFRLIPESSLN